MSSSASMRAIGDVDSKSGICYFVTPWRCGMEEEFVSRFNVAEEDNEALQKVADSHDVILLAFIAPYTAVRVSPVEEAYATIGLEEEFGIETALSAIGSKYPKDKPKMYFLVNSPGGGVTSSYKVARVLRQYFSDIKVFVPHVAASGGTLLAIAGDEIVMGSMSHLSPLDVQARYKGMSVSTTTFVRSFDRWVKTFSTKTPNEAPYPERAMVDKLDPIVMEEISGVIRASLEYVKEVLKGAGYKNAEEIAEKMVFQFGYHSRVIHRDLAQHIGLNVKRDTDYPELWEPMRNWLAKYLYEGAKTHFIRYVVPKQSKKVTETSNVKERS